MTLMVRHVDNGDAAPTHHHKDLLLRARPHLVWPLYRVSSRSHRRHRDLRPPFSDSPGRRLLA